MSRRPRTGYNWRVDCSLVFVAFIWGSTFVLVKSALADVSTLLFLTLRFGLATLALVLFLGRQAGKLNSPKAKIALRGGVLAGICLFSGYVLQTFGLKYTTPAKAGFLTGLYIPLVPLISAVVYRVLPRTAEVLGVICAFAGMVLLTVQGSLVSISPGDLLVAACAVAYAFHILVLGHFTKTADTVILTITQIATSAVLGSTTFWWAEPPRLRWSASVGIALAVTGLLATALAFLVQTWAQQFSSPTRTALIFSMEPVFAWLTSYLLIGEVLSFRGVVGAVLILTGILVVELKPPLGARHLKVAPATESASDL